jgi:hypothetical protein
VLQRVEIVFTHSHAVSAAAQLDVTTSYVSISDVGQLPACS